MKSGSVFHSMTGGVTAVPYLFILPVLFAVFIGVGWTRDNIVEDEVYNLWASTGSDYYQDRKYANDIGASDRGVSSFLAMATSRDSENVFTADRLEEIRDRMEAVENVKINHDGHWYEWKDLCAQNNIGLGTVYEFPCVRLTSMDFFQETSWFMSRTDRLSWYAEGVRKNIVKPRIPRFGIMQEFCTSTGTKSIGGFCDERISDRTRKGQTLNLFGDLSSMEMNNPCRVCIESAFESSMVRLTAVVEGMFQFMMYELNRSKVNLESATNRDEQKINKIAGIMAKLGSILQNINRAKVEEYSTYYTTRGLYSVLGAETYIAAYQNVNSKCSGCLEEMTQANMIQVSKRDLINHADSAFSSINTAGNPLPFLGGPFGGSGIDLSGNQLNATVYFDFQTFATDRSSWNPKYGTEGFADPDDQGWIALVESDPVYKWFMAGETKMTAHCGNDRSNELFTKTWCTDSNPQEDEEHTEQYFAKMWYDLLVDSDGFLGITQGISDPYTWTNGEGCGYELKNSRASYTNATELDILSMISNDLYYLDEGASIGALNKALLMGGTNPQPNDASQDNPFTKVTTIQNIYPALLPKYIPDRVKNCNRPLGSINITVEDAEAILEKFKIAMADEWSKGWDVNDTEVQFTGFFDEAGSRGTFGILLNEITGDNGTLTAISILLIAVVSMFFLASMEAVNSMVGITAIGILLVIISFFGALGLGIIVGIKINITIAWTLPFIIIGLGVDDMYIVLLALKKQQGYAKKDFVRALKEIAIPVSMTSLVNASMFAVMNIVDIGAVYKTAQAALISVIFLYLTILFCFPAFCYLDMKRKESRRLDIFCCFKSTNAKANDKGTTNKHGFFYDSIYKPLLFGNSAFSKVIQLFVIISTTALFVVGIYGITKREIGLGLEDFFPSSHQASSWANLRTEKLASWPIGISWGALNYTNPEDQLLLIKQYEDVVDSPHVTHSDTRWLWMADFNIWTTRQCDKNFVRDDPGVMECGMNQLFIGDAADNSTYCTGTWVKNTFGLKNKVFTNLTSGQCVTYEQGICRPGSEMFPEDLEAIGAGNDPDDTSYCPVFEGWSEEKLKFCVEKWRFHTGGSGGILVKEGTATKYQKLGNECEGEFYKDDEVLSPIPLSSSPTLFSDKLFTHKDTTDLLKETRKICDESKRLHCWMTGVPFDFWEQYLTVEEVLLKLAAVAIAVGFGVSALFLFTQLRSARDDFDSVRTLGASVAGATLISLNTLACLIPVVGVSVLAGVNLTAFSNMAFVLSVGFAVEYSVHIVHRFLSAPVELVTATSRVEHAMEFLALPLTLSFVSSTIGVACLAFTDFAFNERFFFRPLMIVMLSTYFVGTYFLPVVLTKLDFDFLKVGHVTDDSESEDEDDKLSPVEVPEQAKD